MTMGDPAGIGPELALAAWRARRAGDAPFFVLAAPAHPFAARQTASGSTRRSSKPSPPAPPASSTGACRSSRSKHRVDAEPGRPDARNAAATIESIARAVQAVRDGEARAVVTNPIAKAVLYDAGFRFPGHTEYPGRARQGLGRGRHFRS